MAPAPVSDDEGAAATEPGTGRGPSAGRGRRTRRPRRHTHAPRARMLTDARPLLENIPGLSASRKLPLLLLASPRFLVQMQRTVGRLPCHANATLSLPRRRAPISSAHAPAGAAATTARFELAATRSGTDRQTDRQAVSKSWAGVANLQVNFVLDLERWLVVLRWPDAEEEEEAARAAACTRCWAWPATAPTPTCAAPTASSPWSVTSSVSSASLGPVGLLCFAQRSRLCCWCWCLWAEMAPGQVRWELRRQRRRGQGQVSEDPGSLRR